MNNILLIYNHLWGMVVVLILIFGIDLIAKIRDGPKPPRSVERASDIELIFGITIFLFSLSGHPILTLIAIVWVLVALFVYKGNNIARKICLLLSVLRCLTVIGALISVPVLYLLFFTDSAREYFGVLCKKSTDDGRSLHD